MDIIRDPSLVLDLPLWQKDGVDLESSDRYGHLARASGALWTPQGRSFGGSDYINIDSVLTPLASTTIGTWLVWVKVSNVTPASQNMIISSGDLNANELIHLTCDVNGTMYVFVRKAGVNQWKLITDNVVFINNTWALVGLVQNGLNPVLYFNGQIVSATFSITTDKTAWFSVLTGLDNVRLGNANYANNGGAFYLSGVIGETIIYNRALTLPEIQQNYLATRGKYQ